MLERLLMCDGAASCLLHGLQALLLERLSTHFTSSKPFTKAYNLDTNKKQVSMSTKSIGDLDWMGFLSGRKAEGNRRHKVRDVHLVHFQ